jgi:hypothetical protein
MNAPLKLICLVLALVFFAIAAFMTWAPSPINGGPWHGRLIAFGLFFGTLSFLVS